MHSNFTIKNNKLFIGKFSAEEIVAKYGSSLYVYDASLIRERFRALKKSIAYPKTSFHYACKQNTNIEIIKLLKKEGALIEVMSPYEINVALQAGYKPHEIIYTCSYIPREELQEVINKNILMNLDSLTQIQRYGELKPGGEISIRINQGIGAGGHNHLITGGPESKFGITLGQIDEAQKLAQKYKLKIIGIQQHIGSNIRDEKIFMQAINALLVTAKRFNTLSFIDFGGGFGIPYHPEDKALPIDSLGRKITKAVEKFVKEYGSEIEIKFEPGRYYVGEAGMLLAKVTDVKRNEYTTFVGIDAGMNQLIRPAMYGSYHDICNASKINGALEKVNIVGNICESADFFAKDRQLPKCNENDIIAIFNAGASGYCMASWYNGRSLPAEILVDDEKCQQIRKERHA